VKITTTVNPKALIHNAVAKFASDSEAECVKYVKNLTDSLTKGIKCRRFDAIPDLSQLGRTVSRASRQASAAVYVLSCVNRAIDEGRDLVGCIKEARDEFQLNVLYAARIAGQGSDFYCAVKNAEALALCDVVFFLNGLLKEVAQ
jgi:hypothetical protein